MVTISRKIFWKKVSECIGANIYICVCVFFFFLNVLVQLLTSADCHRFPTSVEVIEQFAYYVNKRASSSSPLRLFLHATPRQLRDPRREWIRYEHDTFLQSLRDSKVSCITEKAYFFDNEKIGRQMLSHFKCLDSLETV
jgi:hypothetical protein